MDHGTGNAADHELRIWLFGEFRVAVDRVEVPRSAWQRSKARAVVKVLALASGHRLHREQLMDGLWPDLGPVAASANLRKAIHFARGAMGAHALRVDNEVVRLDGASLWIDVDVFEAAAASGDSAAALGFYVDDLLVEDRFAPWCERRRDQLRAVAARLLLDRSRELEGQGDQRGAIAALERLLQLEPLSEAGHCGLIRLHTLAGRRHVALRWYRQLEDRLRAELGVAPGDEARRLRDDLIAGNVPPEAASIDEDHRDRGSSATLDEERKLVTVAVLEIGGATAGPGRVAVAGRNPERVRAVLDAATTQATEILRRWGGQAQRQVGGTVVAVFGVPSAGEHDAEHALRAALQVAGEAAVPVRIGVDTGVVIAPPTPGHDLRGVVGEPVENAARLREWAQDRDVVASARTCRAARDLFDIGDVTVRDGGAGPPVSAHRVLCARPSGRVRRPGLLVGRQTQLDAALAVFAEAAASGRPHLLTLLGAAGIGKSRLVSELLGVIAVRWPTTVVHRGRCLSFGEGITYWALGEILRETCGIAVGEPAVTANPRLDEQLARVLAPLDLSDRDRAATIAALAATAGIESNVGRFGELRPDAVAIELGRAWSRFAAALVATGPALVVVEDVHWADDQLLEMLERMVARSHGPLVVVTTARPELFDRHPRFGSGSQAASVLSLPPLAMGLSRDLLHALVDAQRLDDADQREVLTRADGNPYFIEEMVVHLQHHDVSSLPDTLHSLLASRVDGLPPLDKRVLQEASVMGQSFSSDLVIRRLPGQDVAASLAGLERRGLIAADPAAKPSNREDYSFNHALLRDVVYASVPSERRADAHLAVAAWVEDLMSNRDELIEIVALHVAAAADELAGVERRHLHTVRPRAVALLLEAGAAARRRFAIRKATELHQRALDLAATDDERMHTLEELGDDDEAAYRGDAARHSYDAALTLARATPDRDADRSRLCRKCALMMAMIPGAFRELPDPVVVEGLITEGLAAAPDAASRAQLLVARGATARLWSRSEPFGVGTRPDPVAISTRVDAVEEALQIGERQGPADLIDAAVNTLAILRGLAGDYAGALALLDRAVDRADEAPSTLARSDVLRTAAVHLIDLSARYRDGLELAWRAYSLTRDNAGPHQLMHVTYPLLAALYHTGRWNEMDALLDEHVAAFRAEPAVHCEFVRDGPIIGAILRLRQGRPSAADQLTALVRKATTNAVSPSAWESFLATVTGDPAASIAMSHDKMRQGRFSGPQHTLAVLEATVTLRDWDTVRTLLPHGRANAAGNALLGPWCDRAEGLAAAAASRRAAAERSLSHAVDAFDELGVRFEAARTREGLADVSQPATARALLRSALDTYEELAATADATRVRSILNHNP